MSLLHITSTFIVLALGILCGWILGYAKGCSDLDLHHKNQLRQGLKLHDDSDIPW